MSRVVVVMTQETQRKLDEIKLAGERKKHKTKFGVIDTKNYKAITESLVDNFHTMFVKE